MDMDTLNISRTLVAPSLLSSDFAYMGRDAQKLCDCGADWLHCDVMDGSFVPNISFGATTIAALRAHLPSAFLDVHLMILDPARYIDDFAAAGASLICVHAEACAHLHRVLQAIHSHGIPAGVALNPGTSPELIKYVLDDADMVLCMSVNPGFGGQKLITSVYDKIIELRALDFQRLIEVDGGVTSENAAKLKSAGANVLVAGSAVFKAPDMERAIRDIRGA